MFRRGLMQLTPHEAAEIGTSQLAAPEKKQPT
jgi:hypothetical protein